ncbi:MAG TPA: hypothetical protein VMF12_03455 [Xanthobacteraceae bacterium]|nr:hypothetical protein [Xanthobacteraceae bacterium]
MASLVNAALCAVVATAFWSLLGYAVARHVLPRALTVGAAPVLGWAVHSAVALPVFTLIGFSPASVLVVSALCVGAAGVSLAIGAPNAEPDTPMVPAWTYAAAALLALAPAAAIAPKFAGDAVYLAGPIFDHSKIAIIDAMARQGLPPINPVFAAAGGPGALVYYYLWHFSAAELALPLHATGWEADIGLTWFTAFASLTLMMALAVWLGKDQRAAILVVVLAAAGSLRSVGHMFGADDLAPFVADSTGFAGWLLQSAWVPQHLMAASCVVTAMLLVVRYAQAPGVALLLTLVLTVVAGFQSSTYVGGVTFAIAALAAAPILFAGIDRSRRLRFAGAMAIAAVLVGCLIAPFVAEQLAMTAARHDPTPIVVSPFAVLGEMFSPGLRRYLDLPAYWLIELPIEFPATYLAGTIALWLALRSKTFGHEKMVLASFACLAGAGLAVSWLLASTLGDNNDLALRAVLPAAMVLIVATAVGILRAPRRVLIGAVALTGLVLGLPETTYLIRSDFAGQDVPDGKIFAQAPELWAAVRRVAPPAARIANNPLYLQDLTPWPVNISWALLADRSSCFAGRELALAFAPLPAARREAINEQFIRVFDGRGTAEDVSEMATKYGCDVVVVVPQDGAWNNDPFAGSADYRLAESRDGRWRIYVKTPSGS